MLWFKIVDSLDVSYSERVTQKSFMIVPQVTKVWYKSLHGIKIESKNQTTIFLHKPTNI